MDVSSVALAGLNQAQATLQKVASGSTDDTVSLSDNAVALIQSKNAFASDIAVLKTADQIEKSALSLFA